MISDIRKKLIPSKSHNAKRFFKTNTGEYSAHDQFLNIPSPVLRKIAKEYFWLPMKDIQQLIQSPFNEERLLALFILVDRYQKNKSEREMIFNFYLNNIQHVNNWNLVDASAHYIIGAHVFDQNKSVLITLSKSKIMWERRIAIVATWYFIRHNQFEPTIKIASLLLSDPHDLIHKAVGWMLREMGKRDESVLINFLHKNSKKMPRTMLRYAIEKFPAAARREFLK